jgi:hypothetical protein
MYRAQHQARDFTKLSDNVKKKKEKGKENEGIDGVWSVLCAHLMWCVRCAKIQSGRCLMSGGEMILRLPFSGVLQSGT